VADLLYLYLSLYWDVANRSLFSVSISQCPRLPIHISKKQLMQINDSEISL